MSRQRQRTAKLQYYQAW